MLHLWFAHCSSLADVAKGAEFGAAMSKLFAFAGLGVIAGPLLEGQVLRRSAPGLPAMMNTYRMLGLIAACHVAYNLTMPESLRPEDARPLDISLSAVNPLRFMRLFSSRTSFTFKKLVTIAGLNSFLEGKNVVNLVQTWQAVNLKWSQVQMTNFTATYGVLVFLSGQYLVPALLRRVTARSFTSATNFTNAFAFFLRAASENPLFFYAAVLPMLPGVNGSSARSVSAMAQDFATAEGFGIGEYTGYFSNLRALVVALSPTVYAWAYSWARENGYHPGTPFFVAAVLGAVLPELIHRSISVEDVAKHSKIV